MITLQHALDLKGGGVVSFVGAGGKTSLMFRLAQELSNSGDTVLTTTTTKIYKPTKIESPEVIVGPSIEELLRTRFNLLDKFDHITMASGEVQSDNVKLTGFLPEEIDKLYKSRRFKWILVEADGAKGRPIKAPASHEPVIPACSSWVVGVLGLDGVGQQMNEKWVFRPEEFKKITGTSFGEPLSGSKMAECICHDEGLFKKSPLRSSLIVFLNKADNEERIKRAEQIVENLRDKKSKKIRRVVIGRMILECPIVSFVELNN